MRHSERPSLGFHMSGPNGRSFHANMKFVGVVDSRSVQGHSRRDPLLHLEAFHAVSPFRIRIISLLHHHGVGSRLGTWPRMTSACVPAGSSAWVSPVDSSLHSGQKSIQSVRHRCLCQFDQRQAERKHTYYPRARVTTRFSSDGSEPLSKHLIPGVPEVVQSAVVEPLALRRPGSMGNMAHRHFSRFLHARARLQAEYT